MEKKMCFICGDIDSSVLNVVRGRFLICDCCNKKLGTTYCVKCVTCGSYSFLPRGAANDIRLMGSNMKDSIAISNVCPTCYKFK